MRFICRWSGAACDGNVGCASFKITPSPSVETEKLHSTVLTRTAGSDAYFSVYLFCVLRKLIKQPFHRSAPSEWVGRCGTLYLSHVEQGRGRTSGVCIVSCAASAPGKGKYKMGGNESWFLVLGWFSVEYMLLVRWMIYYIRLDWTMCKRPTRCGVYVCGAVAR